MGSHAACLPAVGTNRSGRAEQLFSKDLRNRRFWENHKKADDLKRECLCSFSESDSRKPKLNSKHFEHVTHLRCLFRLAGSILFVLNPESITQSSSIAPVPEKNPIGKTIMRHFAVSEPLPLASETRRSTKITPERQNSLFSTVAFIPAIHLLVLSFLIFLQPSALSLQPNIVLIFADDLGYGDIAPYGADYKTPHLDRLAREGRRFTSFYVAQPVCSASRASLLTGCYPNRVGIQGALGPKAQVGIHSNEVTMAELVKQKNYATAMFGKWHLGHHPEFLPTRHGFDEFYGLPYSNDMWPKHPEAAPGTYPDLPLIEGERAVAMNPDQTQLTKNYTERATRFITANKDRPFFLYLAHSMPHVPIYASDRFNGKSGKGLYADVIQEIDWSVGEILRTLSENDLDQNTLVIFTSDNGPWLSYGDHSGSAGTLREGKGTVWEGGVRVPCIVRWPGKVPAGTVCNEPAMTIDLLPTVAHLTSTKLPDHKIDGKNIWSLIDGTPNAKSPQEAYYFYYNANDLLAVRSGPWKFYVPQAYRSLNGRPGGTNGIPAKYENLRTDLALYNLEMDLAEARNVAGDHPEVVQKMEKLLASMRADLGDARTKTNPTQARPPGRHRPSL